MGIVWILIFSFLGFVFASFLGNVAYRKSLRKNLKGYSVCEKCGKRLNGIDLIPVLGFIINKGKCRYCSYTIPFYYPVSELILGLFWGYIASNQLFNNPSYIGELSFWRYMGPILLISLIFFYLGIYDVIHLELDTVVTDIGSIVLGCFYVYNLVFKSESWYKLAFIAILLLVYFIVHRFSKRVLMGFGDIRYLVFLALLFDFHVLLAGLWIASIVGGIVGLILILTNSGNWRKYKVPYIPIVSAGFMFSYILGFSNYVQEILFMISFS